MNNTITQLTYTLNDENSLIAQLGLIILQEDQTLENEFRYYNEESDITLFHSRIPSPKKVTEETLRELQYEIEAAVKLFPPVEFSSIGFGCTSASAILGSDHVATMIQKQRNSAITNPIDATLNALKNLKAQRIIFITPYIQSVSKVMRDLLEENQVKVVHEASFNQSSDALVCKIDQKSLIDAINELTAKYPADAVFISCTSLKTAGLAPLIEPVLGLPILSSNQTLAWKMRRLAKLTTPVEKFGLLGNIPL